MPKFKITYTDPETGERKTHVGEYKDTGGVVTSPDGSSYDTGPISARHWAENHAYALADKNMDYVIVEL